MEEITQDLLKELFIYDNGNLYWKKSNNGRIKKDDKAGTLHHTGYYRVGINYKTYSIHRLIFLYHHGYLPEFIDHINCNKSDNNIENLREVTKSQNNRNRMKSKNCSSQYNGVYWNDTNKKWQAQISLGSFDNEIDAAKFYNEVAKKLFGEYVKLNEL